MPIKRHSWLLLIVALTVSLASMPLNAGSGSARSANKDRFIARPESISRDEAASIAKEATGGRILSVERKGNSYRVKVLLKRERVRTVRIDARTGKLK
ncbi:MAG: PepSY domain-containing protein [Gammaproteobacteria bacterium]|jgi:uncharacterized membrane protein YkoI|nr:PepSY domain-containing protein [Gammaproteobacteria bacterium]MDP7271917.1 PepSY domain-containing protein [Gammaproteobacteria bacterium]HJP04046.1 PepSY domain-containing protein [Gammaproteobacteria bacterium]